MIDEQSKITDLEIQALADGELQPEEAKVVMAVIMRNPKYLEKYENVLKQNEMLKQWWEKHQQEH